MAWEYESRQRQQNWNAFTAGQTEPVGQAAVTQTYDAKAFTGASVTEEIPLTNTTNSTQFLGQTGQFTDAATRAYEFGNQQPQQAQHRAQQPVVSAQTRLPEPSGQYEQFGRGGALQYSQSSLAQLRYGPSGGARVTSMVFGVIATATLLIPESLAAVAESEHVVSPLTRAFNDLGPLGYFGPHLISLGGWLLMAVALAFSGLGPGLIGGLLVALGLTYTGLMVTSVSGRSLFGVDLTANHWVFLSERVVAYGAAMLFCGIAAHCIRRAGFLRAKRAVLGS